MLPETVLARYRIPYLFSLTEHLGALERALTVPHRLAVPGHGAVLERRELHELINANGALASRVAEAILDFLHEPQTAEGVLREVLVRFEAPVVDAPSFYLLQPTVLAFLTHLTREGLVSHEVRDGRSLWGRA